MRPIITLTVNPTIDSALEVGSLESSGKNRATLKGIAGGGGGINVARAIVELGGSATALHTAGGAVGLRLQRLLDEEGLEHEAIEVEGETREAVVIFETEQGRSFHVVPPGPHMSSEDRERILALVARRIRTPGLVVASGSVPTGLGDDLYAAVADLVRETGAQLILDTSGPALEAALDSGVYAAKPNRREAAELIGRDVEDFDDAIEVDAALLSRGAAEIAVTTVGELGAVIASAEGRFIVRTPPLPREARSDRGAGDSFVAGLTLGLARGDSPERACALAVAAAAAAVLTPGVELCHRDDVEELLPRVAVAAA